MIMLCERYLLWPLSRAIYDLTSISLSKRLRISPNFAVDVLKAVKLTLQTLGGGYGGDYTFQDPISDMPLRIDIGVPKSHEDTRKRRKG
jgi:hypothetical protein